MLLIVEHDHVMGSKKARQCFARFIAKNNFPNIQIIVFRSDKNLSEEQILSTYPLALRERIMLTPKTPRGENISVWLLYELCCTTGVLRHLGLMAQNERWFALVPPDWARALVERLEHKHMVAIVREFDDFEVVRLQKLLGLTSTTKTSQAGTQRGSYTDKALHASCAMI